MIYFFFLFVCFQFLFQEELSMKKTFGGVLVSLTSSLRTLLCRIGLSLFVRPIGGPSQRERIFGAKFYFIFCGE